MASQWTSLQTVTMAVSAWLHFQLLSWLTLLRAPRQAETLQLQSLHTGHFLCRMLFPRCWLGLCSRFMKVSAKCPLPGKTIPDHPVYRRAEHLHPGPWFPLPVLDFLPTTDLNPVYLISKCVFAQNLYPQPNLKQCLAFGFSISHLRNKPQFPYF